MSMFHELMMRKKEEIMYATIKGTLTESPEGVFSGFSTSNYITMPITPSEISNCSIKLRFTTANVDTEQDIIWLKRNNENIASYFGLQTHPNENHCYMYSYAPGASSYRTTSFMLLSNTTYDCVINIENGKLSWKIGEPNNLIEQNQMNFDVSSIASFDNPICFGSLLNTGYAFNGSIDFNNSYIILNGTKYNLQAVVGYTIVGSPTITDGVVSGFSSANYLSMGYGKVPDLNNDFEMQCKFTTGNSVENGGLISSNNYYRNGFMVYNGKVCFTTYFNSASRECYVNTNLSTNTTYIVYAKRAENNLSVILYDENKTIINTNTMSINGTISLPAFCYIGYGNQASAFNGSIDLNETYIKINNKLWFNGQQA